MSYKAISAIGGAICFFSLFVPVADALDFASIDFSLAAVLAASPLAKRQGAATIALGCSSGIVLSLRALTHMYLWTPVDVGRVIGHFIK